jgi:hypothetical protein
MSVHLDSFDIFTDNMRSYIIKPRLLWTLATSLFPVFSVQCVLLSYFLTDQNPCSHTVSVTLTILLMETVEICQCWHDIIAALATILFPPEPLPVLI